MTDDLPPVTAEAGHIAHYVSTTLGMALPAQSVEGVAGNFRLLLTHWTVFATPAKEAE